MVLLLTDVYFTVKLCILWLWYGPSVNITRQMFILQLSYISYGCGMVLLLTLLVRCSLMDGAIVGVKYFLSLHWKSLGNFKVSMLSSSSFG